MTSKCRNMILQKFFNIASNTKVLLNIYDLWFLTLFWHLYQGAIFNKHIFQGQIFSMIINYMTCVVMYLMMFHLDVSDEATYTLQKQHITLLFCQDALLRSKLFTSNKIFHIKWKMWQSFTPLKTICHTHSTTTQKLFLWTTEFKANFYRKNLISCKIKNSWKI